MNTFENHFDLFAAKMHQAQLPPGLVASFEYYYQQMLEGQTGYIYDHEIKPVTNKTLPHSETLSEFGAVGRELMPQVIHIVLNGGLGTSMGLLGPKSLLKVKNGMSFFEIALSHAEQQGINMAFMNSFNTERQTLNALKKRDTQIKLFHFMQNKFPKVNQADFKPVHYPKNAALEWNPPGHGDIYVSMHASGILDKLLANNIKYAFISNVDNLRATIEPDILGYFAACDLPFMMEVATKTASDVKGGHLARYKNDNSLLLRELAQCPADNQADFFDLEKYPLFNTNNIWLNLQFLRDYISKRNFIPLPMIINHKTVDYRDSASHKIYQIESAMGAAISIFEGASAILVPRARLLAVKTCNDLLAVRSDCYKMSSKNEIYMLPERLQNFGGRHPKVDLDQRYFSKIDEFEKRFAEIPSLLNCESLTVKGDFFFKTNVRIQDHATLINTTGKPVVIESGTVLKGENVF